MGSGAKSHPGEGVQYSIFSSNVAADRIKRVLGVNAAWWLRSPDSNHDKNFVGVSGTGGILATGGNNARGVVAGLCV